MTNSPKLQLLAVWFLVSASAARADDACDFVTIPAESALGTPSVDSINDWGLVVGTRYGAERRLRAFVWSGGAARDLPLTDVGGDTIGRGSNDFGRVVGAADSGTGVAAVTWWGDRLTLLRGGEGGFATDVNERGQIVGYRQGADRSGMDCLFWRDANSEAIVLHAPRYGICSPNAINNAGLVVGGAGNFPRAFVWQDGSFLDLGDIAPPSAGVVLYDSSLVAVNNEGVAVGGVSFSDGDRPIVWTRARGLTVLPLKGTASAINDWGVIAVYDSAASRLLLVDLFGHVHDRGSLGENVSPGSIRLNNRFQLSWSTIAPTAGAHACQLR